jgi:hypothetical protein
MHTFDVRKDEGMITLNLDQIAYIHVPGKGMGTVGQRSTGTVHFSTGLSLTLAVTEIDKIKEYQATLAFIKDTVKS